MKLNTPRGTHDLIGRDMDLFEYITAAASEIAKAHGYCRISTPIFEYTNLFARSLGDATDVVSKEMYTFPDRGGDSMTLRPEGTAPVARAMISNKLTQSLPQQFFYFGQMFRYERPQKGRQRQFHHFGVEYFGPPTPAADAESILLAYQILDGLGLAKNVTLHLSTLGDKESRVNYIQALTVYLNKHKEQLSNQSQQRLEKNPLRILDSKEPEDQHILEEAPRLADYLNDASNQHYNDVKRYLEELSIPFSEDKQIVRGLDYYTHTVFEFVTTDLGSQGTVLGGGRYDGLVEQLGGPSIPAVGWAFGIERIMLLLENKKLQERKKVCLISADGKGTEALLKLKQLITLKAPHLTCLLLHHKNAGKAMKHADSVGASHAVLIGETEAKNGTCIVKTLASGAQEEVNYEKALSLLLKD